MNTVKKLGKWLLTVITVLALTVYFVRALDSRRMAELGPEHRIAFDSEFDASQEDETDWAVYLAIEAALASELDEKINSDTRTENLVDRFSPGSLTFPGNYASNWNRSYEMSVPAPRGVAVLLHGLTDSPYSMLSTAQTLAGAGYNVVVPRMPGHGFAVGGLIQARWEDWTAAVRIAIRRAMTRPGAEQSLLLVGYSNGGLMAIDYALQCDDIEDMPCPDGLVLLSPAIAVNNAAVVLNLHAAASWLPYFEKFKWLSVLPEIDPFKFTSFPKRAAWEIYRVSRRMHKQLAEPAETAKLPPILTFQSVVDNTVTARAIVTTLYNRLPANGSELVIYDINRNSTLLHLMKTEPRDPADYFESMAPLAFGVTILRNRQRAGNEIDALTLAAGTTERAIAPTSLRWPQGIFSLSHIAIPFRPDDEVYGDGSVSNPKNPGITLGALAPRGEQGVLLLSPAYFMRARYNPFAGFQANHLAEWLDAL
jgi:alpha-beta hydrolase superfamily lysophospholipase